MMMQVYPPIKPSARRAGLNKARLPKQKRKGDISCIKFIIKEC